MGISRVVGVCIRGVAGGGGLRDGAGGSGRGSMGLFASAAVVAGIGSTGGKVEGCRSKLGRVDGCACGSCGRGCGAGGCMGVVGTAVLVVRGGMAGALLLY